MNKPKGHSTMTPEVSMADNYYKWIFKTISPYLGKVILEVGLGYGNMAKLITKNGYKYYGLDHDNNVVNSLNDYFKDNKNVKIYSGEDKLPDAESENNEIDTILSMNVLEHIENDCGHIKNISALMKKGKVILFVPAMKSLYGTLDKQAGHYRRYNKDDIINLMKENNLRIIKLNYFNSIGAIGWFVSGKLLKLKLDGELTGNLTKLYDKVVIYMSKVLDILFKNNFGQSLICIAEKR